MESGSFASETIAMLLRRAEAAGLARIDAQALLLWALGRTTHDRAWLVAHDDQPVPAAIAARFAEGMARRAGGEPLAYITGWREFHGLTLAVDARVLDPRPDTETLVDWALALPALPADARVLDLGTGSGAIALALKKARPRWRLTAVDISPDALAAASANGQRLQLSVHWRLGHWCDGLTGPYDLIVGNPPYVAADDPHLPALAHEPRLALVAGADGLEALRAIAAGAPALLAPGGWLLLEHGHDQAGAVASLLAAAGLGAIGHRADLAGIDRCTGGRRPSGARTAAGHGTVAPALG